MDWRRRVARWRLAVTSADNFSTTLNRGSRSATDDNGNDRDPFDRLRVTT